MMNYQTKLICSIQRAVCLLVIILGFILLAGDSAIALEPSRVLIVDTELPGKTNGDPARIDRALHSAGAKQTRIITWSALTDDVLSSYRPSAIVLSGQGTPWNNYNQADLTRVYGVLRRTQRPMLGICGGHQLLALAFGGKVGPIHRLRPGPGYTGCVREYGWLSVKVTSHDALYKGSAKTTVWLNHCDEVKILPAAFEQEITDGRGSNQAIKHRSRPIYGVQFHPEIGNAQHPYGEQLLHRFLSLATH